MVNLSLCYQKNINSNLVKSANYFVQLTLRHPVFTYKMGVQKSTILVKRQGARPSLPLEYAASAKESKETQRYLPNFKEP